MSTAAFKTTQHRDIRIHYRLEGRAGAPVLVLSNSLGTTLEMWAPQMAALLEHFQVLRYDTRGHGASSLPSGGEHGDSDGAGQTGRQPAAESFGMADLGADVLAVMDHAGVAQAHFCGLSMGGMTGVWLARHHPQRFSRFVLSNTAALIGPASGWDTRIATVHSAGMAAIVPAVLARWFTPGFLDGQAERIAPVRDMLLNTPVAGYAANCAAVRDADLHALLPGIDRPVLVIAGTQDAATTPEQGRQLAAGIAQARYLELDAGHLSNWELPDLFTGALLDFLVPPGA